MSGRINVIASIAASAILVTKLWTLGETATALRAMFGAVMPEYAVLGTRIVGAGVIFALVATAIGGAWSYAHRRTSKWPGLALCLFFAMGIVYHIALLVAGYTGACGCLLSGIEHTWQVGLAWAFVNAGLALVVFSEIRRPA